MKYLQYYKNSDADSLEDHLVLKSLRIQKEIPKDIFLICKENTTWVKRHRYVFDMNLLFS